MAEAATTRTRTPLMEAASRMARATGECRKVRLRLDAAVKKVEDLTKDLAAAQKDEKDARAAFDAAAK